MKPSKPRNPTFFFFFLKDAAPPEIYPLPLHDALPICLQIDADEAFRKEVVTGPVAAVEIGARCFHRQVDEPQIFVDGDVAPDADVAVDGPRVVFPRDRKSTRLNSSHLAISYAVFLLKK